jgi:Sec-independent protein secretion pathway component TatC
VAIGNSLWIPVFTGMTVLLFSAPLRLCGSFITYFVAPSAMFKFLAQIEKSRQAILAAGFWFQEASIL